MTAILTLKQALDDANPVNIADALAQVKLGTLLTPVTVTVSQTSAAAMQLPAYLFLQSIQVLTGTAAAGARIKGAATATPSTTVVAIDPATQIATFEAAVLTVSVTYIPAPDKLLTAAFAE
jgi:hypothetical protein